MAEKTHKAKDNSSGKAPYSWCGVTCDPHTPWTRVTCHRCLQLGYREKLATMVELLIQANTVDCNLTSFRTLRNFDRLATLAQRNRNRFIDNEKEKQDGNGSSKGAK